MNSCNNEGYEIIDSNTSSYPPNRNNPYSNSRYPYATNPNQTMSNNNYNDWINLCEGNQAYDLSPETIAALSAGIVVAGTMLGAFAAPVAAGAIISYGTLLPFLWPSQNDPTIWQQLVKIGNRPFNSEIDQAIINHLLTVVNGLKAQFTDYQRYFDIWKANPSSVNADAVRNKFLSLDSDIIREIETLKGNNSIILLPSYTQVANLHLILLRQAAFYYDDWVKFLLYTDISSDFYSGILNDKIAEYTDYCARTYHEGLYSIKENPQTTWNLYNTYRYEMTLTVLDLVALFPNYNRNMYSLPTQSQLTREIYTNTNLEISKSSIAQTEQGLTKEPTLFTRIQSAHFFSRDYDIVNKYAILLTGNQVVFNYINSNKAPINSTIYGNVNQGDSSKTVPFNQPIDMVKLEHNRNFPGYIVGIVFFLNNIEVARYSTESTLPSESINTIIYTIPRQKHNNNEYYHTLSYIKTDNNKSPQDDRYRSIAFAWTHSSVDNTNMVSPNIITQIPAVKALEFNPSDLNVNPGPGHTGGNLVLLYPNGNMSVKINFTNTMNQPFKIRVRYASRSVTTLGLATVDSQGDQIRDIQLIERTFINAESTSLYYNEFRYVTFNPTFTSSPGKYSIIQLVASIDSYLIYIDKIEIIPITPQYIEANEKEIIKIIQQKTNDLFLDSQYQTLQKKATDYEIDQIASEIETISDTFYPQEKMILLDKIKTAKQHSQSRNLLQNGDFQNLIGWKTSNDITIQTENQTFKENALYMPGPRMTEINDTVFPTYLYQNIEESKLKPYTRYIIRGYIESSKELEVYISRYQEEIDTIMNVSDEFNHINSCEQTNSTTNQTTEYPTLSSSQSQLYNSYHCESIMPSITCQDSHTFVFTIDTGNLDFQTNPGIQLLFKISNPIGYATLGNIEVIEERSLTEKEMYPVQQLEQKWNETKEKQQKETEQIYSQTQQAIHTMFLTPKQLQIDTTMSDIITTDHLINQIPYVYHEWLPNEPGANYDIYKNFKYSISQAYTLYKNRNIIKNGSFTDGLNYWHTSSEATIQKLNDTQVLVLPKWSTQVSQQISIQPNQQYFFRVIAKKEGAGTGYVKISDCTNQIQTIEFQNGTYLNQNVAENQQEYITKTIKFTPQTDQIRIDIGETEGMFKIRSIELICSTH
nr:Cry4-like protein [Bacillus thuringiensis]